MDHNLEEIENIIVEYIEKEKNEDIEEMKEHHWILKTLERKYAVNRTEPFKLSENLIKDMSIDESQDSNKNGTNSQHEYNDENQKFVTEEERINKMLKTLNK